MRHAHAAEVCSLGPAPGLGPPQPPTIRSPLHPTPPHPTPPHPTPPHPTHPFELPQEKLPERGEAYLQFALLYSTTDGARRVRVHTLALPITQSLGTAFRGADLDAYVSYVSRKVASQVRRTGACWSCCCRC